MALSYDDLFALRLALQDNFSDETYIIKELKRSLVGSGMNINEIDNYLLDFYKSFGIEYMTLDIISQNTIGNSLDLYDEDSDDSDEDIDSDDFNDMPELEEEVPQVYAPPIISNIYSPISAPPIVFNFQNSNAIPMNMLSQVISQVLTGVQEPLNMDEMQDVKQYDGVEESSLKELNEFTMEEDSEDSCCICLDNFKKDDMIIKLPCSHQYHASCIKKWFQDSSNKCCICKKEVVKAKYVYHGVPNVPDENDTLPSLD